MVLYAHDELVLCNIHHGITVLIMLLSHILFKHAVLIILTSHKLIIVFIWTLRLYSPLSRFCTLSSNLLSSMAIFYIFILFFNTSLPLWFFFTLLLRTNFESPLVFCSFGFRKHPFWSLGVSIPSSISFFNF